MNNNECVSIFVKALFKLLFDVIEEMKKLTFNDVSYLLI